MSKKEDRRAEIIEASIRAFARHGYHNTTIQNIVDLANFKSPGTIFRYFPKEKAKGSDHGIKDDILRSIFVEEITKLTQSVRSKVQQQTDPVLQIKAFIDHHFEHLQQQQDLAKVLQIELRQSHHFLQDYDHKKLQEYLEVLDYAIEAGQRQGVLSSQVPIKVIRWAMFGAIDEISTNWVLTEGKWPADLHAISEHIMMMFITGLRKG